MQLHNEKVDLKPDGMTKKKIMIAKSLAKNFERFGHTITPQRRRGALPKVVRGGFVGPVAQDTSIFFEESAV